MGQTTSISGGFSDDEGLHGGSSQGGIGPEEIGRDDGASSPARYSYELCCHERAGLCFFTFSIKLYFEILKYIEFLCHS